MMNVTGELLSKMSMEDLDKLFQQMKHPTQEQKESAWKKIDTGIYDGQGNIIGDRCSEEDAYIE